MAKRRYTRSERTLITSGKYKGLPKCVVPGCNNPGQHTGVKRKDGSIVYRKHCNEHHWGRLAKRRKMSVKEFAKDMLEKRAAKAGMSVAKYQKMQLQKMAERKGFQNITDYLNSKHKYRRNRLDYCENTDGRLGFVCTTTIADKSMLEVDHINNNHEDNRDSNHQTICACCHRYKSRYFGHLKDLKYIVKLFAKNKKQFSKKGKKS